MKRLILFFALSAAFTVPAFAEEGSAVQYNTASQISDALMGADLEAQYGVSGIPNANEVNQIVKDAIVKASEVRSADGEAVDGSGAQDDEDIEQKRYRYDGDEGLIREEDMPQRLFNNIKRRY